jgi:hypothetical protein
MLPPESNPGSNGIATAGPCFSTHSPWGGIEAGQGWQDRLRSELQRCRVVLAVVTADWLASRWCFAEASRDNQERCRANGYS